VTGVWDMLNCIMYKHKEADNNKNVEAGPVEMTGLTPPPPSSPYLRPTRTKLLAFFDYINFQYFFFYVHNIFSRRFKLIQELRHLVFRHSSSLL
jgi:hypothetical protein